MGVLGGGGKRNTEYKKQQQGKTVVKPMVKSKQLLIMQLRGYRAYSLTQ